MHLPVSLRISGSHSLRITSLISSFRFLKAHRPFQRRMTSSQAAAVRSERIFILNSSTQQLWPLVWFERFQLDQVPSLHRRCLARCKEWRNIRCYQSVSCLNVNCWQTLFCSLQIPPLMRCLEIYRKWGLQKRLLLSKLRPRLLWDGARPQPRFGFLQIYLTNLTQPNVL